MTAIAATTGNVILSRVGVSKDSPGSALYEGAKAAASLTGKIAKGGLGVAALVTFGTFAELIPGKDSVPDWLFKVLAACGAILAGHEGWQILKSVRSNQNIPPPIVQETLENETLVKDIGTAVAKVSANPDSVIKLSQDILNGNPYNDTITASRELVTHWTDSEIRGIAKRNKGRAEREIDNGNGVGEKIHLSNLSDRLAVLIGYVIGGREHLSDPGDTAHRITTELLNLKKIEEGRFDLDYLVPNEFAIVYSAAKHYTNGFAANNESVAQAFSKLADEAELTKLKQTLRGPVGSLKNLAEEELKKFKSTYNYLKVLQQAIEYVRSVEGQTNLSPGKARNVAVLKAALISGLDIKFQKGISVNSQLEKFLEDYQQDATSPVEKGLKYKLSKLEEFCSKLQEVKGQDGISISVVQEEAKNKTYGNVFSYPNDEFVVFNDLIKEFN